MNKISLGIMFLFILFPYFCRAQGGPPMVTDDPGTPGDGHWEINIASLLAVTSEGDLINAPYIDANYGWGDHVQLKAETGYAVSALRNDQGSSGMGVLLLGVKYRFFDEETAGVSVSTYPQIQFRPIYASKDPNLAQGASQSFLPIEFSKTVGDWTINPEIGYLESSDVFSAVAYGIVLAYEDAKPWEPLFEIHANTRMDGTGTQTLINFGFRYAMEKGVSLIGASGYTVTHTSDADAEWDSYLGFQLER